MTRPCCIVAGPHTQPVREREGRAHWHAMPTTYRKLHRLALCGLPVLEVGVGLAERGDEARDLELVRVGVDAGGLQGVHAAHAVLVVGRGVGLLLLNLLALVLLLAGALHLLRLALWHKHGVSSHRHTRPRQVPSNAQPQPWPWRWPSGGASSHSWTGPPRWGPEARTARQQGRQPW